MTPPKDPPKAPAARDDNWEDEVVSDQRSSEMTADAARRLLAVNPTLCQQGVDTNFIVKGQQKAEAGRVTKTPDTNKEPQYAQAKDPDHLFDLVTQQYMQQKRELEAEISILQAKLSGLKGKHTNAVMEKLFLLDRTLTSPLTQAAMDRHKGIIAEIGFTAAKFMDFLRKKR